MYRILLVDDEALIREAVSENVQWGQYGYELVGSCENGREALEFIRKNPVEVVLTDICMPYLDGMQLSERLSESYPDIKLIILSGYDEFEYARKAIRYGVKEYLLKPITAQEMGDVLSNLRLEMDQENDAKNSMSKLKATYRKGEFLVHSDALLNLIVGSREEWESRRELEELGVNLDAAVYCVAVVELDLYASTDKLEEKLKKESALMAFILYNITQELIAGYGGGEVCQGRDQRTFILFHSDKRGSFKKSVSGICRKIIEEMNRIMRLKVNIGMGMCVNDMKDIYRSYENAENALEYHYVLGGNRIMETDAVCQEKDRSGMEGLIGQILLHIKGNDEEKLRNSFGLLEEILRECLYDRRTAGVILQRIVDGTDELRKASAEEDGADRERILDEILTAGKLQEAVDILQEYCLQTAARLDSRRNTGGRKYAVLALDYMEKNYGDCGLSLQTVCSYLNISPSRFSSILKTVRGATFMDILSGIRMKKAKELLENTDMKNYEIAERVGFNDPHYFSIAFKKNTGKSPTEYAKEMRK